MRKTIFSVLMYLALCLTVTAQDARQRTVETIAQDVMAALPTENLTDLYVQMADLAGAAPQSVVYLASRLKPAKDGVNNIVEYALSGVVNYATDPANNDIKENVRKGLEEAVSACKDKYNRQFLESLLRLMQPFEDTCPGDFEASYGTADVKALEKSGDSRLLCQALWLDAENMGSKSARKILAALKSEDRAVRTTALTVSELFADDEFYAKVAKAYRKLSPEAKADVIYWLGMVGADSQMDILLSELTAGGELGANAIEAVGRIGGGRAADALFALLGGPEAEKAVTALKSIDIDLTDRVMDLLPGSKGRECLSLLDLASSKAIHEAAPSVMAMVSSGDSEISEAAAEALTGVVSSDDLPALAGLLDSAADHVDAIGSALKKSMQSLSAEDKYAAMTAEIAEASHPERFYPMMAYSGSSDAVAFLTARYESGSQAALEALSTMKDITVAPVLLSAGELDQNYIRRYVDIIEDGISNPVKKYYEFTKALEKADDKDVIRYVLAAIGRVQDVHSFNLLGTYLDNPDFSYVAAVGAKSIASGNVAELDYYQLKNVLTKAAEIFLSTGDADDGYAADEIRKILDSAKPYEKFELSEEEKAAGYEVLFDGTDLSKWTGDKMGYTPVNGCISVTASYGNERNLYTVKEYTDFILRFEFCFERRGVNNGVGIRTPMGVDAAYYGMCEVQVLDHDAPIYADLRPYQVHGSVYGVVPAKRIVHKPLGEWSTEEIRVVGDRITVIVNGEVIVDADIRKACKGHNVAPDGGEYNPFTVDGRNHPGMFNKKGHIGFLGHGSGLKYRNVRVLDLSK